MSSRREVLIRILAMLQRKTLIETTNRTLKWHYWTVRSIKNDGGQGICPLFSSPPRGTCQLKSPHPQKFAIQGKKNANARGGGWAQVELTDAIQETVLIALILQREHICKKEKVRPTCFQQALKIS